MAGRGRPKKSTAQHDLQGTYRADRHGGNKTKAEGEPFQIVNLTGLAAKLWQQIVPRLVSAGFAKEIDSLALCTMCCLAATLYDVLSDNEIDEYKRSGAVSAILKQLNVFLAKFGMTPVDRQAMHVAGGETENPFAAFLMGLHGSEADGTEQQAAGRDVHRPRAERKTRSGKARQSGLRTAPP